MESCGVLYILIGEIFWVAVEVNIDFGWKVKVVIEFGWLVSDEIMIGIVND